MRKILFSIGVLFACAGLAFGQTSHIEFKANPTPNPVGVVSVRVFGTAGTSTCTYWVSAVYPQGETTPTGPASTTQCPGALSGTNFVRVMWHGQDGALRYNVFKTATAPATGSILLGTSTSNSFLDDTGQALTAWTKPVTYPPSTISIAGNFGALRMPVQDSGGQVFNVKAYGAVGDGVTDDTASIQAAYNGAAASGGTIYLPPGTYKLTSTINVLAPIKLQCAPGNRTILNYTPTTGDAINWSSGTQNGNGSGAGIFGCSFTGPGSTTSTSAINLGATALTQNVSLDGINIGVFNSLSQGFGTGVKVTNAFDVTLFNPSIQYTGTGIDVLTSELVTIMGGSISGNTTSIISDNGAGPAEVTAYGTSFDSDTGPYVIVKNDFNCFGCHFETNGVSRSANGFIENLGFVTLMGGEMLEDTGNTGTPPAITTVYPGGRFVQSLYISGTYIQGDMSGNFVISTSGATTGGGLRGNVSFYNNTTSSGVFDGLKPEQFIISTPQAGPTGAQLITFPSASGTLAIQGANGVSAKRLTLSGGTATWTFATAYASAPVCTASDQTATNAVRVELATTTSVKIDGTTTDVVQVICTPAAN